MRVLKAGKHIIGAKLSNAEQKALNMEVDKQLAERTRQNEMSIDAIILWQMHEQLGFGVKRLKRFYFNFIPHYKALADFYEMRGDDKLDESSDMYDLDWLHIHKLQEIGVDLEEWQREAEKQELP